jgi:hypothetical protein
MRSRLSATVRAGFGRAALGRPACKRDSTGPRGLRRAGRPHTRARSTGHKRSTVRTLDNRRPALPWLLGYQRTRYSDSSRRRTPPGPPTAPPSAETLPPTPAALAPPTLTALAPPTLTALAPPTLTALAPPMASYVTERPPHAVLPRASAKDVHVPMIPREKSCAMKSVAAYTKRGADFSAHRRVEVAGT